jgi:hypothetical protein
MPGSGDDACILAQSKIRVCHHAEKEPAPLALLEGGGHDDVRLVVGEGGQAELRGGGDLQRRRIGQMLAYEIDRVRLVYG